MNYILILLLCIAVSLVAIGLISAVVLVALTLTIPSPGPQTYPEYTEFRNSEEFTGCSIKCPKCKSTRVVIENSGAECESCGETWNDLFGKKA